MERKIIDLGCGRTPWPVYAPKEFKLNENDSYTGLDIFPEVIKAAEESISNLKGKYKFVEGDILEPLPFEDSSFTELHFHGINPRYKDAFKSYLELEKAEEIDSSFGWDFMGLCNSKRPIGPMSLEHFLKDANRVLIPKGMVYVTCEHYFFYPKPSKKKIIKKLSSKHGFDLKSFYSNELSCFIPFINSRFLRFSESYRKDDKTLRFFILEKN
jgi:hypothetical protein